MKINGSTDSSRPCPLAIRGRKLPPLVAGSVTTSEATTAAPRRNAALAVGNADDAARAAALPLFAHRVKSAVIVPESATVATTRVIPAPKLMALAPLVTPS